MQNNGGETFAATPASVIIEIGRNKVLRCEE